MSEDVRAEARLVRTVHAFTHGLTNGVAAEVRAMAQQTNRHRIRTGCLRRQPTLQAAELPAHAAIVVEARLGLEGFIVGLKRVSATHADLTLLFLGQRIAGYSCPGPKIFELFPSHHKRTPFSPVVAGLLDEQ